MKPLKIAIGYDGRATFLEKFPDDEDHGHLHDLLEDAQSDLYGFSEKAGIYLAYMMVSNTIPHRYDGEVIAYLEITRLEPIMLMPIIEEI